MVAARDRWFITHALAWAEQRNTEHYQGSMNSNWMNVHGAGAQRSDSKEADFCRYTHAADGYYFDMSPPGDAARIFNYVRPVRDL
ncbi:MAG: hypothetical protein AB2794_12060 [Candidatus Thiodiazotropha endolucinida]